MAVIKAWVAKRMVELLGGLDDDITIGMTHNLLDEPVKWAGEVCDGMIGGAGGGVTEAAVGG